MVATFILIGIADLTKNSNAKFLLDKENWKRYILESQFDSNSDYRSQNPLRDSPFFYHVTQLNLGVNF